MAHEIGRNDQVVLHGEKAWHGLGLVVENAPTPREAAKIVFPYTVASKHLFTRINGQQHVIESHRANVRSDTGEVLGVVTDQYQIVQPEEVADFCEALSDSHKVKCETAGSIRNGRRLWFLLKGEGFDVKDGDTVMPYVLVSNGYDGTSSFRVTPTTVRVVCSNTLHAVIPQKEAGALGSAAISIKHTTNIMDRLEEAKLALAHYHKSIESTKEVFKALSVKDVTSDQVKQFFLESYTADFGEIPENPQDGYEQRRRDKAMSAFNLFSRRFDDERAIAGASAWNMANAYSGLIQHDRKARGQDDADRIEKRVSDTLFGLTAERTNRAFERAFKMALAT